MSFLWFFLIAWLDGLLFGGFTIFFFTRGWIFTGSITLILGGTLAYYSLNRIVRILRLNGHIR